jgi:ADP-ribose pyrophosphatase YjhB (NUDIX family)
MTTILPVVITILQSGDGYVFIERKKEPYSGLWSLVGGKMQPGEHIHEAAIREVSEETGSEVLNYRYRGFVSERLVDNESQLITQFLIFVGKADVSNFESEHAEGKLASFTREEIDERQDEFLPSDWHMFKSFESDEIDSRMYEAEMKYEDGKYSLVYYRKVQD